MTTTANLYVVTLLIAGALYASWRAWNVRPQPRHRAIRAGRWAVR